jgi:hypothetical protein
MQTPGRAVRRICEQNVAWAVGSIAGDGARPSFVKCAGDEAMRETFTIVLVIFAILVLTLETKTRDCQKLRKPHSFC